MGLRKFCGKHTTIVSSVLMRCGPTTMNGTVRGELMPSCAKAIPALAELGVESELWLGETDSSDSALKLWDSPDATVKALTLPSRRSLPTWPRPLSPKISKMSSHT